MQCAVLCSIEDQCLSSTFDTASKRCRMDSCIEPEIGSSSNEIFMRKTTGAGNENIYKILKGRSYFLRFELTRKNGQTAYAKYETFRINDESDNYRLTVGGYSGTAGDALESYGSTGNNNGQQFSTHDRDNDEASGKCAVNNRGAWWYKKCTYSNLNGDYNGEHPFPPRWYTLDGNAGMKHVTMKIRRSIEP
ncbi:unnamed protein product [Mytilus coruscus]|uniref:Fibrinogen C-terminal domain-containing protein n=1 Tax=Mytilus coruscus TaxID=42192 RepID=A0A6J8BA44_MYTCO|nr:unnamed protein product [Mytilus coruscus]